MLKPGGKVVGLDWVAAMGLTKEEYLYWIGAINVGWEATIGTPEEISYCMRQAGFKGVDYWDIHHLPNAMAKPRHHFTPHDAPLKLKYGTSEAAERGIIQ